MPLASSCLQGAPARCLLVQTTQCFPVAGFVRLECIATITTITMRIDEIVDCDSFGGSDITSIVPTQ